MFPLVTSPCPERDWWDSPLQGRCRSRRKVPPFHSWKCREISTWYPLQPVCPNGKKCWICYNLFGVWETAVVAFKIQDKEGGRAICQTNDEEGIVYVWCGAFRVCRIGKRQRRTTSQVDLCTWKHSVHIKNRTTIFLCRYLPYRLHILRSWWNSPNT